MYAYTDAGMCAHVSVYLHVHVCAVLMCVCVCTWGGGKTHHRCLLSLPVSGSENLELTNPATSEPQGSSSFSSPAAPPELGLHHVQPHPAFCMGARDLNQDAHAPTEPFPQLPSTKCLIGRMMSE